MTTLPPFESIRLSNVLNVPLVLESPLSAGASALYDILGIETATLSYADNDELTAGESDNKKPRERSYVVLDNHLVAARNTIRKSRGTGKPLTGPSGLNRTVELVIGDLRVPIVQPDPDDSKRDIYEALGIETGAHDDTNGVAHTVLVCAQAQAGCHAAIYPAGSQTKPVPSREIRVDHIWLRSYYRVCPPAGILALAKMCGGRFLRVYGDAEAKMIWVLDVPGTRSTSHTAELLGLFM